MRRLALLLGALLVLVGALTIGLFVRDLLLHNQADQAQAQAWRNLVDATAGASTTDTLPGGVYLRLTVPKLSKDGVAVNGDWNSLKVSSMVHYKDSPAPGDKGNMLIAFHRETHWIDIDQVHAGDALQVETVDQKKYVYQVDFVRVVHPIDVALLQSTSGYDLTLITCTPPWQDYNRMLFRAHLVSTPGASSTPSP
jgi:LPXTG-site transpeptidase (sortase) family protein